MNLLEKKKVIITGGTSGIGKEIAILFAKNGADVVIFGTNHKRAELTVDEIKKNRINNDQDVIVKLVDVAKTHDVQIAIEEVLADWHQIDVLVNNAGITKDNLLIKMKEEEWDQVLNVNLKSVFNTCRCVIRKMLKQKSGKIINISSVIGLTGNAGQVNYAASKSGIIGFTKSLAQEVARKNICINCIAPGYVLTPMTEKLPDSVKEKILEMIPLKRFGLTADIANSVLFLASHFSDYITGQVLSVDGGMTK